MYSVGSSQDREPIAPFTTKYAQRISKIHEQREKTERLKENDVLYARSAIGSTFRVSSADQSKSYNAERTFGPVRPLSVGRTRSGSAERSRSRSGSTERQSLNGDMTTTSIQRAMSSFDKELQVQKDIAAKEKQKVALLQVKKESYINYLKNKGNTPWIPGGEGAKHESSLHKSVNKSASEQRMLQRAWCRSPWPGLLPKDAPVQDDDALYINDERANSVFQPQSPTNYLYGSPGSPGRSTGPAAPRYASSPQRLPSRVQALGNTVAPPLPGSITPNAGALRSSGDSHSVASTQHSRASTANARKSSSGAGSDGNSKYVALTVRLIQAQQAHKSAYGVFIVPRNCTRLEMIANLERQFNVHNQVSDISITYRTGYSHGVTIKSLSMGTIADVPQIDDYSSITVFLGGSTIFDSAGNIITHTEKGDTTTVYVSRSDNPVAGGSSSTSASPMTTVLTRGGIHGRYSAHQPSNDAELSAGDNQQQQQQQLVSPSTDDDAQLRGLAAGDNLLYFDDNTSVGSADDASSTYSRASKVSRLSQLVSTAAAPSVSQLPASAARSTNAAANASFSAGSRNRPVQVPLYEKLHPEQPMHGFSYISPAQPLLGDALAAAVLATANEPRSADFAGSVSGGSGAIVNAGARQIKANMSSNNLLGGGGGGGSTLSRGYSTRSLLAQQQAQVQPQQQRELGQQGQEYSGGPGTGTGSGSRMLAEELLDDHHQQQWHGEEGADTSGALYHEAALRRSIMEKKSSFRDRDNGSGSGRVRSTSNSSGYALYTPAPANYLYSEPTQHSEKPSEDRIGAVKTAAAKDSAPSKDNSSMGGGGVRHVPRDWLAEAEAQLRLEQQREQQYDVGDRDDPLGQQRQEQAQRQNQYSGVEEDFEGARSPTYRGATTSSALRRRERAGSESSTNQANNRDRAGEAPRGRSRERTNSGVFSVGSASGAGSFRSAGQRSRSADPLSRSQSQSRLFPPANPPAPRAIRSTASSRGRDAFINSRVSHFDEVNHNIYANREAVEAGGQSNASSPLRRSNSSGRLQRPLSARSSSSARLLSNTDDGAASRPRGQRWQQELQRGQPVPGHNQLQNQQQEQDVFLQQHNFLGNKIFSRSSEELDYLGQELSLSPVLPPHLIAAGGAGAGHSGAGRGSTGYSAPSMRQAYFPPSAPAYGWDGANEVVTGSARSSPHSRNNEEGGEQQIEPRGATSGSVSAGGREGGKGRGRSNSRQLTMNLDELLADLE